MKKNKSDFEFVGGMHGGRPILGLAADRRTSIQPGSNFRAKAIRLVCISLGFQFLASCAVHRASSHAGGSGVELFAARESSAGLISRSDRDSRDVFAGTLGISHDRGDDPLVEMPRREKPRLFHVDFALRVSYTLLRETKQDLDRYLDTPLKTDVLNLWDSPNTPLDRRSDLGLMSLYVGLGSEVDDWLVWTVYVGGGAGSDKEHQRVGNLNLETEFDYLHVYTGVLLEMYPWGKPGLSAGPGLVKHLKASRPYVLAGLEVGFVDAEGSGHYSAAPVRLYEHSESVRDLLVSHLLGLGWGIPISERWAFNISTHYAFHYYRPDEYNSWVVTTALRYRF